LLIECRGTAFQAQLYAVRIYGCHLYIALVKYKANFLNNNIQ